MSFLSLPEQRRDRLARRFSVPAQFSDDQSVDTQPEHQIDYLCHDWKEEDVWASWRYMITKRTQIPDCARLENTLWRVWVKTRRKLQTLSPKSIDWLKHYDITWLYGPLRVPLTSQSSETRIVPQPLPTSSSFSRKSILETTTPSAVSVRTERLGGQFAKTGYEMPQETQLSSFVSTTRGSSLICTLSSERPDGADKKSVLFNEEVRQSLAVKEEREHKLFETKANIGFVREPVEGENSTLTMTNVPACRDDRGNSLDEHRVFPLVTSISISDGVSIPRKDFRQPQEAGLQNQGLNCSTSPSQEIMSLRRIRNGLLNDNENLGYGFELSASKDPDTPSFSDSENHNITQGSHDITRGASISTEECENSQPHTSFLEKAFNAVDTFKDMVYLVRNAG